VGRITVKELGPFAQKLKKKRKTNEVIYFLLTKRKSVKGTASWWKKKRGGTQRRDPRKKLTFLGVQGEKLTETKKAVVEELLSNPIGEEPRKEAHVSKLAH